VTATTQNRITSGSAYTYDTAGNMTAITGTGGGTFTFNAENQMIQAATASTTGYVYDGDGKRVEKTSTGTPFKLYWYGMSGDPLDETDQTGVSTNGNFGEYIFFGGRRIARRDSANNVLYYAADHLGTSRVMALVPSGQTTVTLCYDADFYPFGGERSYTTTCSPSHKFTGKERDAESGLDNFKARYDSSSIGRFMTTDPVVITTERLTNPQQLNLYAYVANNPLRFIDPTGEILQCVGGANQQAECFADLQQIAGDAANRLSMDAKTGVISFDTTGLDLSKNEGASLINDLVGSKNTYDFSVGPTVMTDKGPVRIDILTHGYMANLPTFGDQTKGPNPPAGISDIFALNLNNGNLTRTSNTNLKLAAEWTIVFHELAEAYAKIDGGMGGSYAAGHNEALQREMTLRDQRPYLKDYNTGAGGPANSPNPQESYSIIIKK